MSEREEESASWEWHGELAFDAFLVFLVFFGLTFTFIMWVKRQCCSSSQAADVEEDGESARIHHFWGGEPSTTRCPSFIVKWARARYTRSDGQVQQPRAESLPTLGEAETAPTAPPPPPAESVPTAPQVRTVQIHLSPLLRSTFCPMKIDHKSGLTLHPG